VTGTITKLKPSSGWGLAACLLVLIAIDISMCETVVDKPEPEPTNQRSSHE